MNRVILDGLPAIHPLWFGVIGALVLACIVLLILVSCRVCERDSERWRADHHRTESERAQDAMDKLTQQVLGERVTAQGLRADLDELRAKMWGEPVLPDRDLRHMLAWIDEAREAGHWHKHRAQRYLAANALNLAIMQEVSERHVAACGRVNELEHELRELRKFIPKKALNGTKGARV